MKSATVTFENEDKTKKIVVTVNKDPKNDGGMTVESKFIPEVSAKEKIETHGVLWLEFIKMLNVE